jgi:two-component system LytT family response regulator
MLNIKITAAILENSKTEAQKLMATLQHFPEVMVLDEAFSGEKGLSLIANHQPRLVFINLELPDMSGFELANVLNNKDFRPLIVFLTNDGTLAFDALPYQPFDFFVKPVRKELVEEMLQRLKTNTKKDILEKRMENIANGGNKEVKRVFNFKKGIVVLHLNEIIFCKADRTKSILLLNTGEELTLSTGITETIEIINDNRFLKCSRSYYVNRNYLRKIDKRKHKCIVYNNGNSWEIPVSRTSEKMLESMLTYPLS